MQKADGGVEITTLDAVDRSRLTVDSLKWYLCKLAPKKYGDKVAAEVSMQKKPRCGAKTMRGRPCQASARKFIAMRCSIVEDLVSNGRLVADEDGVLYVPRMARDGDICRVRSEAGKQGGLAKPSKTLAKL